jgi:trans-aconitate 2-methyltransferase
MTDALATQATQATLPTRSAIWDPAQYDRFADERGRPFVDLVARIRVSEPSTVIDLGCGPGNLTATLSTKWPAATVIGVDNDPNMLAAAARHATPRPF